MTYYDQKLFIPQLDDKLDLLESTKPASGSCSVVYRGKRYIYGQGLINLHFSRAWTNSRQSYRLLYNTANLFFYDELTSRILKLTK